MSSRLYLFGAPCRAIDSSLSNELSRLIRANPDAGWMRHRALIMDSFLIRPGTVIFTRKPALKSETDSVVPRGICKEDIALFWLDATHDGTIRGHIKGWADEVLEIGLLRCSLATLRRYFSIVGLLLEYLSSDAPYTVRHESLDSYMERDEESRYAVFTVVHS